MQKGINSICIVGGGTAGWMAASLLSNLLKGCQIKTTVVESPDISTIGVGESTVPSIIDFLNASQIDLKEFIKATSATFKLGIRFDDWYAVNEHYFHPFGHIGRSLNGFDFYQVWLKSLSEGNKASLMDYSVNAEMAKHNRFVLKPKQTKDWVIANSSSALHLDASQVTRFLRELCLQRGVERIEATVSDVVLNEQGFIDQLHTDCKKQITSDFFIDCTGFKALLIEKALGIPVEEWSKYLPCDRAVTIQTQTDQPPVPYTIAKAQAAGWSWTIPLQHRTGNGYVFSSKYCTDEQAIKTLTNNVQGKILTEPNVIPFTTGKREKVWHKNCLALGLAGGFLEPLESTAIHLVYKTLVNFSQHFPDTDFDEQNEQMFNQKMDLDYLEIRDFIILHYATAQRADTDFWQMCQQMPIPESLNETLSIFKKRGELKSVYGDFFTKNSWCAVLEGMHIRPNKYYPLIDGFDPQKLANMLMKNAQLIKDTVSTMPLHSDFIHQHCRANK
ncbi:tryptophan halogenase family protein [Thalassotalea sp. PP2-459]|uniref:tryptophan halogenase family protein n=1 Tax=Thalassotalea sp. PP2-459 TaxID=1742724 RepID=UPI000944780E|nr:tryptophan halogenase family protein [Thalassotalea sp. PP2-459]OKY26234.1 tryptophan halogenase [Thalassotalea sp. PP2-459]